VIFLIIGGGLVAGAVYGLNRWEYVQISTIDVKGAERVRETQVKDYVSRKLKGKRWDVLQSRAITFVPTHRLEKQMKNEFSLVKTVKISRKLPATLTVTITEEIPLATQCHTRCYQFGETGRAIKRVPKTKVTNPKLIGNTEVGLGERALSEREARWLKTIKTKLKEVADLSVTKFVIEATFKDRIQILHVYVTEGYYLKFDSMTPVLHQIRILPQILTEQLPPEKRQTLEYIDLRIKNRAYYK